MLPDTSPQSRRSWVVFFAIAIAYCVAFLAEPDWNLKEAHLLCAGQPVQVFESITACSVDQPPGCPCVRPRNPWVIVYWLALLAGVGIATALLRYRSLRGAFLIVGAMVVGGYGGFLLLSRREMFAPEAWGYAPFAIAAHVAITLFAFWSVRLIRYLVMKRRPAT